MRVSLFVVAVGLAWLGVTSGAEAQFADCGRGFPPCDGHCLMPAGEMTGSCIPPSCVSATDPMALGALVEACFTSLVTGARGDFAEGDCDGDFVPNGTEDRTTVCARGVVAAFDPNTRRPSWTPGQRLNADEGGYIAPRDARSTVANAIGIGCSETRACPHLPSDDVGLASRCVFLAAEGGAEQGVCTYYVDPRDDRSCVGTPLTLECVNLAYEAPHEQWEHGDCDGDGLFNKLDPHVCEALSVVGVISPAQAACAVGHLDLEVGDCPATSAMVTSTRAACATDGTLMDPFALCCETHSDCPMEDDEPPLDRGFPRCVQLNTFGRLGGACTYNGSMFPDDVSCRRIAGVPGTCFGRMETDYQSWVDGNCDGCDMPNRPDPAVCECAPDAGEIGPLDAGGDAASPVEDGGGANLEDDATVPMEDAGPIESIDADVEPPPPPSVFAGSGCRCVAAGTKGSASALQWLVIAGLLLGGPLLRRRKR